jgi:hypothetical protein
MTVDGLLSSLLIYTDDLDACERLGKVTGPRADGEGRSQITGHVLDLPMSPIRSLSVITATLRARSDVDLDPPL